MPRCEVTSVAKARTDHSISRQLFRSTTSAAVGLGLLVLATAAVGYKLRGVLVLQAAFAASQKAVATKSFLDSIGVSSAFPDRGQSVEPTQDYPRSSLAAQ